MKLRAPTPVRHELDCLAKQAKKIKSWVPMVRAAQDLALEIGNSYELPRGKMHLHVSVSSGGYYSLNGVHLTIHGIQKDSEITVVLKMVGDAGFRRKKNRSEPEDYGLMQRRTYYYEDDLMVSFFFEEGGEGCKFVEVGQKLEKEYKFLCPDSVVPEPETAPF